MFHSNVDNIPYNNPIKRFLPTPESVLRGLEPEPKITDFTVINQLGSGSYGQVILAQHKITKVQYAIKVIDKRNQINIREMPYFIREIEIMYLVHHPNVVKLYGHFEDNNYCYFIMEYVPGGNIYSLVERLRPVTLREISSIMKDVISAVYFLHNMSKKIIHRDIKPENVLLDQNNRAKLTDFGWSNYIEGNEKRTTVCGTPVYLAPEVINNIGYDERVDIWCIGILLFELIVGRPPFDGDTEQKIRYNIVKMRINWPNNMDSDAADLISRILKYNPEERISLEQMLLHPFFTKFFPNAISSLIKPDQSIKYSIYIISKHNPLTWNPIYSSGNKNNININTYENDEIASSLNVNYDDLYQKYEILKKEYNDLKKAGYSSAALDSLSREIKEKEEKINQLINESNKSSKNDNNQNGTYNGYNYQNHVNNNINIGNINNYDLGMDYNNLINENNITGFNQAFDELKTDIDIYTQNDYNNIISMKNNEIQGYF